MKSIFNDHNLDYQTCTHVGELGGHPRRCGRRAQRGQALIIALAVLFLLAFLASLFALVIIRNLEHTNEQGQTLSSDYYAQAGINYANRMLQDSALGADWRPPVQYAVTTGVTTTTPYSSMRIDTGSLGAVPVSDPDLNWLNAGFTRYNIGGSGATDVAGHQIGGGRFLIRITYSPNPLPAIPGSNAPPVPQDAAKYLKIEVVGRTGVVNSQDPTANNATLQNGPRTELVAYKPIGIVDYARFITNKYDRSDTATLGVPSLSLSVVDPGANAYAPVPFTVPTDPPLVTNLVTPGVYDFDPNNNALPIALNEYPIFTTYGGANTYSEPQSGSNPPKIVSTPGGGSLRANCNLRIYGANVAYLNGLFGDEWEVAGSLTFDGYSAVLNTGQYPDQQPTQLFVDGTNIAGVPVNPAEGANDLAEPNAYPTNDPNNNFTTDGGLIRDGVSGNDAGGYPRNIKRLNPPTLTTADPATNLSRYQTLVGAGQTTMASANASTVAGYPATIYVNNTGDVQVESPNLAGGGYTLRGDWLSHSPGGNLANANSQYWLGSIYTPPAVSIVFGQIQLPQNGGAGWGITLTRSDTNANGNPVTWVLPNGVVSQAQILYAVYGPLPGGYVPAATDTAIWVSLGAENDYQTSISKTPPPNDYNPYNNVLIYAEGNVRVRGMVSPTSISGIYQTDPGGNTNTAIQHVTVVTNGIAYIEGSILKGGPNYNNAAGAGGTPPAFESDSSCAILAKQYITVNTTQFLAGALDQPSDTNVDLTSQNANPPGLTFNTPDESVTEHVLLDGGYPIGGNFDITPQVYVNSYVGGGSSSQPAAADVGLTNFTVPALIPPIGYLPIPNAASQSSPTQSVVNLSGGNGLVSGPSLPEDVTLTFKMDHSSTVTWVLQSAAVVPSDVRIEAVLYAENNSFFMIPGEPFNPDTLDTLSAFKTAGGLTRPGNTSPGQISATAPSTDWRFPFYDQPIDMQITIAGSVSENLPGTIGDQSSWMQLWGWIPAFHGGYWPGNAVPDVNNGGATIYASPHATGAQAGNVLGPGVGLNFSYDPMAGFPYDSVQNEPIREDQYGRPLPFAPDLPVSPDLVYSGNNQVVP